MVLRNYLSRPGDRFYRRNTSLSRPGDRSTQESRESEFRPPEESFLRDIRCDKDGI